MFIPLAVKLFSKNSNLQCELKKIPPEDLWQFFQNGWEFFNQILHAYYMRSYPIYARLQIFIQLSATLTKLCHIKRDHHDVNVHHQAKRTLGGRT